MPARSGAIRLELAGAALVLAKVSGTSLVPVVINGHAHGYEHLLVDGVHYAVSAGSGGPRSTLRPDRPRDVYRGRDCATGERRSLPHSLQYWLMIVPIPAVWTDTMKYQHHVIRHLTLPLCLALSVSSTAWPQSIGNPDVFAVAAMVAEEVELVREVMGRPFDDSPRLPASDVSQQVVYFQAQTLFRKMNQLAQENAGVDRVPAPPLPEGGLTPADTLVVVEGALEQARTVKRALGIDTEAAVFPPTSSSSTGTFMTILDVNRQINLLMREPLRPTDVFGQVTLAAVYAAGILAHSGESDILPAEPPFDGYKRPSDVYGVLLRCAEVLGRIGDLSGAPILRISPRRNIPDDIEPGHVYDIATIVVAGLALVFSALDAEDVFPTLEAPERIFPTQVYARANVLLQQLERIEQVL